MNEQLIKFIELCLVDGVITDKEREVIFRKSKELGVSEDECEIILEGMLYKSSKNNKPINDDLKNEDNSLEDEKILKIDKLKFEKTSDEILKKIFESNYQDIISKVESDINRIKTEISPIENKMKKLNEELLKFDFDSKIKEIQNDSKKLITETEFDIIAFKTELKKIIDESVYLKNDSDIDFIDEHRIKLFELKKGFLGKRSRGDLKNFPWVEFLERYETNSDYYVNENDIKLIDIIKNLYNKFKGQIKNRDEGFEEKIIKNREAVGDLCHKESLIKNEIDELAKTKKSLLNEIDELNDKVQRLNKLNNSTNFDLFKKLYNNSPILFQSNIYSRYLQTIEINNDKQIENLTRFLNFIIKKERDYSKKISRSFKSLEKGELSQGDFNKLIQNKDNLKLFYNCFHIMYQGLVSNKMGLFMKVYIELEGLGIFNTFFEENVMNNLNMMNRQLEHLNSTLKEVSDGMSKTNNYLKLLNHNMYDLKLSVDETNLNLMDISSSIQDGNSLLREGNEFLDGINSGVGLNNILTGIQTYQMYKINKNTKSLRG